MAYVFGLFWTLGLLNALIQYLYTGKRPESLLDLIMPRTGRKVNGKDERVMLPSYMKDLYHAFTDFLGMLDSKISPILSLTEQAWHNEDFRHEHIVNKDHPALKQLEEAGSFLAKQYVPISTRAYLEKSRKKLSVAQHAERFVGLNPVTQKRPMTMEQKDLADAKAALARASEHGLAHPKRADKPLSMKGLPGGLGSRPKL